MYKFQQAEIRPDNDNFSVHKTQQLADLIFQKIFLFETSSFDTIGRYMYVTLSFPICRLKWTFISDSQHLLFFLLIFMITIYYQELQFLHYPTK